MAIGHRYGLHRVLEPPGALPQPAWRLDNDPTKRFASELVLDVERLNVDAASFRQILGEVGADEAAVAARIAAIVAERGKLHNPVTGSGGMLIGRVREIGPAHPATGQLAPGDRVATLVSLTLTPLHLRRIRRVHLASGQVEAEGTAILFASGVWARLPDDVPERVALAVLDVCGAPALTARLVQPGDTVLVLGAGGKSGLLCLAEARRRTGPAGRVLAVEVGEAGRRRIERLGVADAVLALDATQATEVLAAVEEATAGRLCDVVISCVSVPNAEMAAILACRDGGAVLFFSMATSFSQAALGAEGVGKDVRLFMGNGYAKGHAELALDWVRRDPALRALFAELTA